MKAAIVLAVLGGAAAFVIANYEWVFAKKVKGTVIAVERVTSPTAILGSRPTDAQMYSYSVLIQGDDGVLYTSSSEDRQWQVVKKGYCIDTLLYRYPPWHLDKANTYFNARVEQIRICPGQTTLPDANPAAETVPAASPLPAPTPPPHP